jgi:hypothetical protein
MDWKKLLGSITASVDEELRLRNAYLAAENRILRQQICGRVPLTDSDRKALADIGKKLGRQALTEIATVAKPDTILAWHRKRMDQQTVRAQEPQAVGRPRIAKELEDLVMRMARENRSWGYNRIVGALANLGYTISDQTVGNILKRHGIPPAPERKQTVTWREFIRFHMAVLGATDFFTREVWGRLRLVPHVVLAWLFFASGKMGAIGRILSHYVQVLLLCTCNPPIAVWGVLKSGQFLIHHWDGEPCPLSAQRINTSRRNHLLELPRPPNVPSSAVYGVHCARGAWRSQLLLWGERSVPQVFAPYAVPVDPASLHHNKGHVRLMPSSSRGRLREGPVWWHASLSGLWQEDQTKAA